MNKKINKKINIALFGGSFDPPHIAHEQIVKQIIKNIQIDKLFIAPTYINPFKEKFYADQNIRYKWLKTIFKNYKKVSVLDYEIKQNRAVATIETVKYLKKSYDINNFYLIIGADNLKNLHKWKNFNQLNKLVTFIVATRNNIKVPKNLINLKISANISSTKLRETLDKKYLPTSVSDEIIKYYKRKQMNKRIDFITSIIDEKKGENIQVFDMKEKDYFVDTVIISTTLGERHGASLLDDLKTETKKNGEEILGIEESGEWIVIDLGDILIHLMTPEYRAKYNIENFLKNYENNKQ